MLDAAATWFYGLLHALHYQHPFHPTQVHIPIGLVTGALILGLLGLIRRRPEFSRAAWYCMNIALVFMIPTVLTGLLDWRHFYAGAMSFPFREKFTLAAILLALLCTGYLIGRKGRGEMKRMVLIYTFCFFAVAGLGYFGGELVHGGKVLAAAPSWEAGRNLFEENCNGCHPNGGNKKFPKRPLKNSPKTSDLKTFISWIRAPEKPMPVFTEKDLSNTEASDLFDYITNVLNKS